MLKFEPSQKKTTIALYVFFTLTAVAVIAYAIFNLSTVLGWIKVFFGIISPIVIGFIIAYLCNPVMMFFHNKVFAFTEKKKPHPRLRRALAVLCAFIVVLGFVSMLIGLFVPQIVNSYADLSSHIKVYIDSLQTFIDDFIRDFPLFNSEYTGLADFINVNELSDKINEFITGSFNLFDTVFNYITSYLSSIVSGVGDTIMGVILAIYFLLSKEKIMAQIRKITAALVGVKRREVISRLISLADKTFGGYVKGAFIDALFVGFTSLVIMSLFGIPYAPLIAVMVGATNVIPYFGPFIGAIPSGLIILISDPPKVITFAIIILVIQQIDGNLICPRIMNNTTGLDALLVILALTVGGGLFGFAGMLLSIPTFAMLYIFFKEYVEKRLVKNGQSPSTVDYYRPGEAPSAEDKAPSALSKLGNKLLALLKKWAAALLAAIKRFIAFLKTKFKRKPKQPK